MRDITQKNSEYLAKGNGTRLIHHSELTSFFAAVMAEMCLQESTSKNKTIEIVKTAGYLHDVGKILHECQLALKNNTKLPKMKYSHNQIAWAILSLRTNFSEDQNMILNPILWHHGVSQNPREQIYDTMIYDTISEKEIEEILDFVSLKYPVLKEKKTTRQNMPSFFEHRDVGNNRQKNGELLFIRSCVISADRTVSSLSLNEVEGFFNDNLVVNKQKVVEYVQSLVKISSKYNVIPLPYEMSKRLTEQISISEIEENTIIINAPAGKGKTFIGIYKSILIGKKVIWVCPRNTIAKSVYESILVELKNWNKNLSVELFLTGKVIKSNHESLGFDSDIIVTNIDNFLAPTINHKNSNRLFLLNNATIIFDEYHEFISKKEALFAGFITMMLSRSTLTTSKTILLSATPLDVSKYWDTPKNATRILPLHNKHFSSPHSKKYKINICDENILNDIIDNSSSLIIFNSVTYAQDFTRSNLDYILYHGKFEEDYKSKTLEHLINEYGKTSLRQVNKTNVISTHALQASLDISFCSLYESVISPLATLQRIGRIDRWGDYLEICHLNFFLSTSKNETSAINKLYSLNITKKWFECLKKYNGQLLSLDELYQIYNDFNIENKRDIDNYVDACFLSSLDNFGQLYPISFDGDVEEQSNVHNADSNKLRATGSEFFYIIRKIGTNEWVGPFTDSIGKYEDFGKKFNESMSTNPLSKIKKIHKLLKDDVRFDFSKLINDKKLTINTVQQNSKKSDTPYIVFNRVYDPKLGIVKILQ